MHSSDLIERALTESVLGAFFEVYNTLGFGFLEHIYVRALNQELVSRGHTVAREVFSRVTYKGEVVGMQRIDMVVDEKLVVEVKSSESLPAVALRQLLNYLKGTELEVGLLLHFGPDPKFYRRVLTNRASHGVNGTAGNADHADRADQQQNT